MRIFPLSSMMIRSRLVRRLSGRAAAPPPPSPNADADQREGMESKKTDALQCRVQNLYNELFRVGCNVEARGDPNFRNALSLVIRAMDAPNVYRETLVKEAESHFKRFSYKSPYRQVGPLMAEEKLRDLSVAVLKLIESPPSPPAVLVQLFGNEIFEQLLMQENGTVAIQQIGHSFALLAHYFRPFNDSINPDYALDNLMSLLSDALEAEIIKDQMSEIVRDLLSWSCVADPTGEQLFAAVKFLLHTFGHDGIQNLVDHITKTEDSHNEPVITNSGIQSSH